RAVLNTLAILGLAGFSGFMAIRGYGTLAESIEFNSHASTPLQTPLWVPQTLWVLGLAMFAVVAIAMGLHSVVLLFKNHAQLNKTYGPPSLQDEVDEQMAEAERVAK